MLAAARLLDGCCASGVATFLGWVSGFWGVRFFGLKLDVGGREVVGRLLGVGGRDKFWMDVGCRGSQQILDGCRASVAATIFCMASEALAIFG